jgi:hypothetical protein
MNTTNWIILYIVFGVAMSVFITSELPHKKWARTEVAITTFLLWPIYVAFILAALALRVPARKLDTKMLRYRNGKPYGLYNRFDFGKHYGEQVQEVIRRDPDYITYCLNKISGFKLTEEAEEAYEEAD